MLSAISAGASAGAARPRRACCAELVEKQPSAQGISTSAVATSVVASGHSSIVRPISETVTATARPAPTRSMLRLSSTLPTRPKAPNHANIRLICVGVAESTCL